VKNEIYIVFTSCKCPPPKLNLSKVLPIWALLFAHVFTWQRVQRKICNKKRKRWNENEVGQKQNSGTWRTEEESSHRESWEKSVKMPDKL